MKMHIFLHICGYVYVCIYCVREGMVEVGQEGLLGGREKGNLVV